MLMRKRMMCLWTVAVCIAFMGFHVITFAGDLEPSAPPAPTMKTLDEIPPTWSQKLPAAERFELVLGGAAVLDKETGLVWEQSPSNDIDAPWTSALSHCYNLEVGDRKGWHLPTVEQLASLVDLTQSNPALPSGYVNFFSNVQSSNYWSSTTSASNTTFAWVVYFGSGNVFNHVKTDDVRRVWCVRGGQSHDAFGN